MMMLEKIPHQVTLIHVFSDAAAIRRLVRFAEERLVGAPGFRALAVLESLDGERVVAHEQWDDEVSYRGALLRLSHDAGAREELQALMRLPNEPHLYDTAEVMPPEKDPIIDTEAEAVTVVDIFTVRPGGQEAGLRTLHATADFFLARRCGFIGAAHYVGRDGVHVASYTQWESARAHTDAWTLARRFGLMDCEAIKERHGRGYRVVAVVEGRLGNRVTDSLPDEYENVPSHI